MRPGGLVAVSRCGGRRGREELLWLTACTVGRVGGSVVESMAIEVTTTGPSGDGSVGLVERHTLKLFSSAAPMVLAGGGRLDEVTVAYETYGTLSPQRDNAIFVWAAHHLVCPRLEAD